MATYKTIRDNCSHVVKILKAPAIDLVHRENSSRATRVRIRSENWQTTGVEAANDVCFWRHLVDDREPAPETANIFPRYGGQICLAVERAFPNDEITGSDRGA